MLRTHHYRVNQSPILNPIQLGMPVSFSMGRDMLSIVTSPRTIIRENTVLQDTAPWPGSHPNCIVYDLLLTT